MNQNSKDKQEILEQKPEKKPNENAGFYFSSHLKIFDPNTKEIFVKKRGDN
jgi:hypothetical protein